MKQVPEINHLEELDPTHHGDNCPLVAARVVCDQCGYPACEALHLEWPVYEEAKGG